VAFAVGQLIQDFLVGIGPMDAVTYITISMMLAAVAMAACLVPARRAIKIDPMPLRNGNEGYCRSLHSRLLQAACDC
jgi:hypothetical protein